MNLVGIYPGSVVLAATTELLGIRWKKELLDFTL